MPSANRTRRAGTILLSLLAAGLVLAGLAWFARLASAPPRAPAFRLDTAAGRSVSLADFDGQIVVLNFWASWCGPCRAEMPMLSRAARALDRRTVAFIGITVDQRAAAQRYLERYPVSYPIVYGPGTADLHRAYIAARDPAGALPYTVIVDRKGRIVSRFAGRISRKQLDRALSRAIGPESESAAG